MKIHLLVIALLLSSLSIAQKAGSNFNRRVDSLMKLLDRADTLTSQELYEDTTMDLHGAIERNLKRILTNKRILKFRPDSLVKHDYLFVSGSKDGRLWLLSWFENTGGSFRSFFTAVHYRTKAGLPGYSFHDYNKEVGFPSYGGTFQEIHKLPHATKDLYLCIGTVMACNTCLVNMAVVVELTKDSINFTYPAFDHLSASKVDGPSRDPDFSLESRWGNTERFEYDPKKQTLYYAYEPDDNTPVSPEEAKKVSGQWRWNGKYFVQKEWMQ